jgi:RecB family exonuclease
VLDWLRNPAVVRQAGLVDVLEARVRREGLADAQAALQAWDEAGRHLPAGLPRVRDAARAGTAELCAALGAELARLTAAAGTGPGLDAAARADAAAIAAGRRALDELAALAAAAPDLAPGTVELAAVLEAVEVVIGDRPGPGRVTVADPLALRARRVRALILCSLQEGELPRAPRPEPFFGEAERRELAATAGIRLPLDADGGLGAERYLFYATVSRPEERLVLSFRTASDDGDPAVPSFFLDDVRDLFGEALWERRVHRPLGAVAWPQGAPTPSAAARERAAAGPRRRPRPLAPLASEPALRALRERPAWSASGLEAWAACPVRWFVERYLEAGDLEADPEPMVRGSLAHAALEDTLRDLREQTGSARLTPERLPAARARLGDALREAAQRARLSPSPERLAAGLRRLEADLERYLEAAAHDGSAYEPTHFEVGFGFEGSEPDALPALEIEDATGEPVRLRGRIDRIDVEPGTGRALVVDYKGRRVTPGEKWAQEGSFQAALYLRAARDLLGLEPVGAFYQPLGLADLRRRGLIAEDADPDLDVVSTDRRPAERVEEVLSTVISLAGEAAAQARSGALEPRPETCTPSRTCAYPGLCRCEV